MDIDKSLYAPTELQDEAFDFEPEVEIGLDEDEGAVSTMLPDGGMEVMLGPQEPEVPEVQHFDNLALYMDESDLGKLASELIPLVESDLRSRADWERAYMEGLDLLGMKIEDRSEPWPGASGVYHPLLTEAVVRFQSQTMTEIFPAAGPAKTQIIGEQTPDVVKQAKRVEQELNYLLTDRMSEFRPETETLLFRLPLAGSAFKKVWFDDIKGRPVSAFVPAEDMIVHYGASDLESCERFTYRMRRTHNELLKLQAAGIYRDIDVPVPQGEVSDPEREHNKLAGEAPSVDNDDRHTLYEIYVDFNLPGPFASTDDIGVPYIITIEKASSKVLSIYRNWQPDDPLMARIQHFVHYPYMPGMGFYGMGLIHLMGGLAKSATSILRQLIDAGTLSNLPGGLKTRGLRIRGDDRPIMPGEWRDVDIPGGQLADSLFPLPYKEPSSVLYQLLGNVIDEGRRIGSIADIQVGEMSPNTPVGTTLAMLERSLKVMSAVQARVHWSLKNELKIISRLIAERMAPEYEYNVGGPFNRQEDFSDKLIDVIPVSDTNASTMAQRVVKMQAAITLASATPQLYNMKQLHRQAMEALDIPNVDLIIPLEEDIPPSDPATENMNMIMGGPVKVYYHQDHEAHIAAHTAALSDPKIIAMLQQSPSAESIASAFNAHMLEHIAYSYRKQIEQAMGAPLPDPAQPIPPELESGLSLAIASAAEKVKELNAYEQSKKQAMEAAKDPVYQIQLAELGVKKEKLELDVQKLEWQKVKDADAHAIEREKMGVQVAQTQMQIVADLEGKEMEAEARKEEAEANREMAKQGQDQKMRHEMGKEYFKASTRPEPKEPKKDSK